MSASSPIVELHEVGKRFSRDTGEAVLDGVSLSVERGELVAVLGPSGCGKSTILNIIAGLLEPTDGRVSISQPNLRIAYVFQRPRLLPWRSVLRNVEFGLEQRGGADRRTVRERARRALELVRIAEHETKYPHELSGGMQQRVALARGLALDPSLFLLDEPFGALDALTRSYLQEELLGVVRSTRTTTVLVTHDIDEALILADRVLVMSSRPGRIKAAVEVPFGPDRSMDLLLSDPRYARIRTELRQQLRPEVASTASGQQTA